MNIKALTHTLFVIFILLSTSVYAYIPPVSMYCKATDIGDVWCNDVDDNYVFAKGSISKQGEDFFFVSGFASWGEVGYPSRDWYIEFKYTNRDATKIVKLVTINGEIHPLYTPGSSWYKDQCTNRTGCIISW